MPQRIKVLNMSIIHNCTFKQFKLLGFFPAPQNHRNGKIKPRNGSPVQIANYSLLLLLLPLTIISVSPCKELLTAVEYSTRHRCIMKPLSRHQVRESAVHCAMQHSAQQIDSKLISITVARFAPSDDIPVCAT